MKLLIGKRFVVMRDCSDPIPENRLPIILARGRAFGSGEHETTRSCLEELEEMTISSATRALDLGSGTGILAVAAARMGAGSAVALDPCPEAIQATLDTIRLNEMIKIIAPVQGDIAAIRGARFDLILANVYSDVLLPLVREITSLLAPNGSLLMSGIQFADCYDIEAGFTRAGCAHIKTKYLDDYSTVVFRKQP